MGIPPDIAVPVFPPEELRDGRDSGLSKAIETILK
jgi:C-terminal processing protease CtpA/Prc